MPWLARSAALSDALEELLNGAIAATTDGDKGATRLITYSARFEGIAAMLEQDLIAHAATTSPAHEKAPHRLLRTLAEHEQGACSKRQRT